MNSCSNDANPGGPGCSDKTPHPRGTATTEGAAGPVSEQSTLRTLVLAIKGRNSEGKRQFRSEFISQAGPVVQSLGCGPLFATPWTVTHQAPLSIGFSRHGYRNGLPLPSPGDLPDPGIKTASSALAAGLFVTRATWEAPYLVSFGAFHSRIH